MRRWRVRAAGIGAGLLLISVYFIGFRQPQSAKIAEVADETDQLRAQQVPLSREIKGLEEVAAREAEFRSALEHLERFIPARLAQPALVAQLQTVAEGAGVALVSVAFGDPEVPKGAPPSHVSGTVLVAMPVTAIVEGPYLRITDLLRRVEVELDRAVLVGTIALTEAELGFPQLRGTWSGQAYALIAADDPLLVDPSAPPVTMAPSEGQAQTGSTPSTTPARVDP